MVGTIHTGSSAIVAYGFESVFGGGTSETRMFGKEQKTNSLEFNNSQQPLAELYSPEVTEFIYKKEVGSCSMEYILSNPWIFAFILNDAVFAASTPNTHTWDSDPDQANVTDSTRVISTAHLEFYEEGFAAADFIVNRNAKGVICKTLNIKTSLDAPVKCTQQLEWGKEDTVTTTLGAPAPITTTGQIVDTFAPYTFAHGAIKVPISGGTIAAVQDIDITFDTGGELLYAIQNTAQATDAWRKLLTMTGKIQVAIENSDMFTFVQGRTEIADMELVFTNGLAGNSEETITITFTGAGFSKHVTQGLAPGELLMQTLDFQCRKVVIVADNDSADQFP